MTTDEILAAGAPPIVAILRGVRSDEVPEVGAALIEAGMRIIEVPLNSPDPFASIRALQRHFGDRALIGAGTVLDAQSVEHLADTGAGLMVTPNTVPALIELGLKLGLEVMPGFLTPSEAFAATGAGAKRLKLFPASITPQVLIKAVLEVLPSGTGIWAVGGIRAENVGTWLKSGAEGVASSTGIFRPGDSSEAVHAKARAMVAAWRAHLAG